MVFLQLVNSTTTDRTPVEVPDQKSICTDRPIQSMSLSRPPHTECTYVQTFLSSKICVRSSCVPNTLCPDFRAFKILYDQISFRYKPKTRTKFEQLSVHAQTIVRPKTPMSRRSCVRKSDTADFANSTLFY